MSFLEAAIYLVTCFTTNILIDHHENGDIVFDQTSNASFGNKIEVSAM